jgi:para-aminobenzoate synthetase component I
VVEHPRRIPPAVRALKPLESDAVSAPIVLSVPGGPPLAELAAALPEERWPMLFDSGPARSELGRWSLLAFDPVERLQRRAGPGGHALTDLAQALERCWPASASAGAGSGAGAGAGTADAAGAADAELPGFRGGAAGWFGYDLGRELERLPERCRPDADVPDLCVGLYPFALAEELGSGRRLIVGRGSQADARAFAHEVAALGKRCRPLVPWVPGGTAGAGGPPLESTFTRKAYLAAVRRVREHILDGEVYQVNLCQRFALPFEGSAAALQAALRARFPAPFGALLRVPGLAVVSSSPELFLRRRGARLESRPIKGTRPRHADPERDRQARAELEASPKERAELAMIVDLVRNDLGRTAAIGSVAVEGPFRTDAWSTVYHRVATVSARVPPGTTSLEVLAAAFPPASVTGTPKLAALAVIESLEPVRRHVYTGAIGWIGADGDMDLSVAIRIATLAGGRLLASFGGGITLASDPAAEYDETLHKARALCEVLGAPLPLSPSSREASA